MDSFYWKYITNGIYLMVNLLHQNYFIGLHMIIHPDLIIFFIWVLYQTFKIALLYIN